MLHLAQLIQTRRLELSRSRLLADQSVETLTERLCLKSPSHPARQTSSAIPSLPLASKTTLEVFTGVSPDNSLERLAERRVGLITDRPSNVDELPVTLFE